MSGAMFAPVHVRILKIDGKVLPMSVMKDIPSINYSDEVIGQDTLSFDVFNHYQKYFNPVFFKRGMVVSFSCGMAGYEIKELFSGPISRIGASSSGGQRLSVHCTVVSTATSEYKNPSMEVYKQMAATDAIAAMCAASYIGLEIEAVSENFQKYNSIIADWFPDGTSNTFARSIKIAHEFLGVNASVKSVNGNPTMVLKDPPQSSSVANAGHTATVEWGKDIKSYSFDERSENRSGGKKRGRKSVSRMIEYPHPQQPFINFYDDVGSPAGAEKYAADIFKIVEEQLGADRFYGNDLEVARGMREDFIKNYHRYDASANSALNEAKFEASNIREGEREMTGTIVRAGLTPIVSATKIKVVGIGPYSGVYFTHKIGTSSGSEGLVQTIEISSLAPKNESSRSESSGESFGEDVEIPEVDDEYTQNYEDQNGDYEPSGGAH